MIRIKFEVEEPETGPLPIENENVGSPSEDFVVTKKQTEKNLVVAAKVPKKVVPKKKKKPKLDNSTMDSVAVGSKSIKTEPAESSLSLTTQLNNSLNIQSLLRQNRIQNGWTTNEQSIPNGTQQQQQSFLLPKIEPFVPDNQEVPLSLDQSFLISNLNPNSGETTNCDTTEIPSLAQCSSNLNGTQQQQQQKFHFLLKIEPIVLEIHQEVPLSLDQSSSIPNLKLVDLKVRAEKYRYDMENESEEQRQRRLERMRQYARTVGNPRRKQLLANATPEQLEQRRLKERESNRRKMENETEEQRQKRLKRARQYNQKRKQQLLDSETPEQLELRRLKQLEAVRRHREKEAEERRQQRLEQRREQKRKTMTVSKTKRKPGRKHLELSMSIDSDSSHFDIDGGEESNGQTITTLEHSPKPGPSKLPRPTRCQSKVKSKIYLEPDTDSDEDSD